MKKLLLSLVLFVSVFAVHAQLPVPQLKFDDNDTIPNDSLIISEVLLPNWSYWGYYELTNTSHDTLHMANFFIISRYASRGAEPFVGNGNKLNLAGTLMPGESYLIVAADYQPLLLDDLGNLRYEDGMRVNREVFEMADTFYTDGSLLGGSQLVLLSRYQKIDTVTGFTYVDSAKVDLFNSYLKDNPATDAIAGIGGGTRPTFTLWHRKTNIKKGNLDWNASRSDDISTSEWIYTTHHLLRGYKDFPYTTIKSHFKNETLDVTPTGDAQIDMENMKITFPYGIRRDSVFRKEFTYGPNVVWDLKIGPDSTQYYLQTNDTIIFMLPGDSVTEFVFNVEVSERAKSFAGVRPYIYQTPKGTYTYKYTYSDGIEPIDTIGGLEYDLSVDSLLKYIVIEDGCTYDIKTVSGVYNSDVKYGDTLVVTAETGDVRKYKLAVKDYSVDYRPELKRVIFPGLFEWENPKTFNYTDTFLYFSRLSYTYNIELPEGTEVSPAIIAVPVDPNAHVTVSRAKNLSGSKEDRTAKVMVVSENLQDTSNYSFTFVVKKPSPELDYSLFYSDFGMHWGIANNGITQIYNPSDETIDMGDYMLLKVQKNWGVEGAQNNMDAGDTNKWNFRPGYVVVNTEDGPVFAPDFNQTNYYIPSKGVYSLVSFRCYPYEGEASSAEEAAKVDYRIFPKGKVPGNDAWPDYYGNKASLYWNMTAGGPTSWMSGGGSQYLLKLTNDSVKDGTKAMNKDFLNDYEVVDVLNGWNNKGVRWKIYDVIDGRDTVISTGNWWGLNMYRKSNVYKGNPVELGSFGIGTDSTVIKPGEWKFYGQGDVALTRSRFENHVMDYKEHIASVASVVYNVTPGIEGEQDIFGVATGTSVQDFVNNLILADTGAHVVVFNSVGTKEMSETLVEGDKLMGYSARGLDSVLYKLNFGALDDDITLSSTEYVVNIASDKKTGTITGVPFGITIEELLSNVEVSDLSILSATDGGETILPIEMYSKDTLKIQAEEYTMTLVGEHVYLEVRAQNGDVCLYSLEWEVAEDPYVLSNVYVVDETKKEIDFVDDASVSTFIANLIPAPGCTLKVHNQSGNEREIGDVKYSDRLIVSNGTKSVTYFIKFSKAGSYVGIEKTEASLGVNAYPNPSNGVYQISGIQDAKQLKVYNISGQLVKTAKVQSSTVTLDLSKETRGIYMVKLEGDSNTVLKLVKE